MNNKDYKKWSEIKSGVHNEKKRPHFHEREIWFCNLGENIGYEQDGKGDLYLRPVLILRKFNNETCWVIPLTRNQRKGRYYYAFSFEVGKSSNANLSQLRLIDVKRLEYKSGYISESDFLQLKQKLKQLFA